MSASTILCIILHLAAGGRIQVEHEHLAVSADSPPELLIEYGYMPDSESPTFVSSRDRLFAFTEEENGIGDYRVQRGLTSFLADVTTSENAESQSQQLSASMQISARGRYGAAAFAGAIAASTSRISSGRVRTMRLDSRMRSERAIVKVITNELHLKDRLAPGVEDFFNTQPPEEIFRVYGAFRAKKIWLGGSLRTTVIRELRESEDAREVEVNMSASVRHLTTHAAAEGTTRYNTAANATSGSTQTSMIVRGGDTNLWFGHDANADFGTIQRDWAQSVNNNTEVATKFTLDPLWRLIRQVNPAKADAFKEFCLDEWRRAANASRTQLPFADEAEDDSGLPVDLTGFYTIQQKSGGRYLDASEGQMDDSEDWHRGQHENWHATTRTEQGSASQHWYVRRLYPGSQRYTLQQVADNAGHRLARHLDAHESDREHYRVATRTQQNNLSQQWVITDLHQRARDGHVVTIQQATHMRFLDAEEHGPNHWCKTALGTGRDTQRWILTPLSTDQTNFARGLLDRPW